MKTYASKLTRQTMLEVNRTPKGGWTKDFLASIGVSWPPPAGWKEQFIASGKAIEPLPQKPIRDEIIEAQADRIERLEKALNLAGNAITNLVEETKMYKRADTVWTRDYAIKAQYQAQQLLAE